ncbi:hypothetical protein GBF38_012678 [Nibea albiflora]|uniref:Uncharacterized protein n=1 Tax=Nibea albiflora TaxID=240163 RepID=A0ACB7EKC0_NIBAL|nr:hypothetical protein GBF38_012678 [Nibea albiflora]
MASKIAPYLSSAARVNGNDISFGDTGEDLTQGFSPPSGTKKLPRRSGFLAGFLDTDEQSITLGYIVQKIIRFASICEKCKIATEHEDDSPAGENSISVNLKESGAGTPKKSAIPPKKSKISFIRLSN